MAKIATRDGWAVEKLVDGTPVRRLVKAGDVVPGHYEPHDDEAEGLFRETADGQSVRMDATRRTAEEVLGTAGVAGAQPPGSSGDIDSIRTHAEADEALAARGIDDTDGTVEEKKDRIREHDEANA